MTFPSKSDFTFKLTDQVDVPAWTPPQTKTNLSAQAVELLDFLNSVIAAYASYAAGDSGSKAIGVETIDGIVGNDLQTVLANLKVAMDAIVAGSVPGGSIVDSMLGNGGTDIKARFADHLVDYTSQPPYVVATGSANTYVVSPDPALSAYTPGIGVVVKINVDNTGASTLNVSGLGAIPIKTSGGNALVAGNLKANSLYTFRYGGSSFIVQGDGGDIVGTAVAADLLSGKTATVPSGLITGTMTNNGVTTVNPLTTEVSISGYYPVGSKVAAVTSAIDADIAAGNILSGVNILGVDGTASNIKSIQRGTIQPWNNTNVSATISISAIDPTKSVVIIHNNMADTGGAGNTTLTTATIDANNIYLNRAYGNASAAACMIAWEVIEFNNVKSRQTGTSSPGTTTISAVDPNKSMVIASFRLSSVFSPSNYSYYFGLSVTLTNSTTLTVTGNSSVYAAWQVIEFN